MLEIRDYLFVHDFCKKHLLSEEGDQIKDRYSENELKTIGWPVCLSAENY